MTKWLLILSERRGRKNLKKKNKKQKKEGFKGWKVNYSKYQIKLRGKKFPFFLFRFCASLIIKLMQGTIVRISHTSKVMLKILQARLQQGWTKNFQMFKVDLEKAEEAQIKLPTSAGSSKKQGNSNKMSTSASLTMLKPLTVCITTNCGNSFFKRWEYQTTLPAWEKPLCRSRSNS